MAERDESFLSRWSRLKRRDTEESLAPQPDSQKAGQLPAAPQAAPAATDSSAENAEPKDPNADLPSIESLDRESDYTAFMRAGVAPDLRRQALQKLWRSDPVFANLDGLLEYGEDYSLPFKRGGVVSTVYQVGKGMISRAEESDDQPTEQAAAEGSASPEPEDGAAASLPSSAPQQLVTEDSADARDIEAEDDQHG